MVDIDVEGYVDHPEKFDGLDMIFRGCIKAKMELPEFLKSYLNKVDLVTYADNGDKVYEYPADFLVGLSGKGRLDEAVNVIKKSNAISYMQLLDSDIMELVKERESGNDFIINLEELAKKAGKIKFLKVSVYKPKEGQYDCDDD